MVGRSGIERSTTAMMWSVIPRCGHMGVASATHQMRFTPSPAIEGDLARLAQARGMSHVDMPHGQAEVPVIPRSGCWQSTCSVLILGQCQMLGPLIASSSFRRPANQARAGVLRHRHVGDGLGLRLGSLTSMTLKPSLNMWPTYAWPLDDHLDAVRPSALVAVGDEERYALSGSVCWWFNCSVDQAAIASPTRLAAHQVDQIQRFIGS